MEGSVNVMGRKGGNRLFPTLTLTLTFHHPEQSLLHKLHWLDHVIRVGVFSVRAREQTDQTTTLCVQEVEIYLERWEVLGALVDVCVERRKGS